MDNIISNMSPKITDPKTIKKLAELKAQEKEAEQKFFAQYVLAMKTVSADTLIKTEKILEAQFGQIVKKIREEQVKILFEAMSPKEKANLKKVLIQRRNLAKGINVQPTEKEKKDWGLKK
jgi:hypothetical protein